MQIREVLDSDMDAMMSVEKAAFGFAVEAGLVRDLADDPSAVPFLSLLAFDAGKPVGHILFTRAWLEPESSLSMMILAPLAVVPAAQRQGVGGRLIEEGIQRLRTSGVDLVFVLGYPEYYRRHGFAPASRLGFDATYPIDEKNADAWMVRELRPGVIGTISGRVVCADALNKPELWCE